MKGREDVTARAVCEEAGCPAAGLSVSIEGRINADGEFEAFHEGDFLCMECDSWMSLEDE